MFESNVKQGITLTESNTAPTESMFESNVKQGITLTTYSTNRGTY